MEQSLQLFSKRLVYSGDSRLPKKIKNKEEDHKVIRRISDSSAFRHLASRNYSAVDLLWCAATKNLQLLEWNS
ncbi:hypothetical protein CEXT_74611 [Caerostris extrusa]|uniref:Uncharacterized protein n=1 Tax=Caerostris extrusa TaxID=172846 RepID=A0AAV4T835_CAEEX|nr:hypothetical protein CEXT_74611 [Caerostris extrusa]